MRDAAASALLTLGDGNWKMGEGVQVGKGPKSTDLDERTIMEHFLCRSIPNPPKPIYSHAFLQMMWLTA